MEWSLQQILGIPVVTIIGGVTGVNTLLGIIVAEERRIAS